MTSLPTDAHRGAQQPRISSWPDYASTAGDEAVELAEMAGLFLDDWQKFVLKHSLGEKKNGKWAAFEVGLVVSRQNGKGAILEARELAGLFLLGERMIIHSAHQFDTSLEAFGRLLNLIENTPDLERMVKRVVRSHGEEGITLRNGQRIRFRTRTKGGGRGFTADCVILDEAMVLPEASLAALMPTLSARTLESETGVQIWYTGSAVDQASHADGQVFSRIRHRGLEGGDESLAFFEWSAPFDHPDDVDSETAADPEFWAVANPGLGIRIDPEHVANEYRSFRLGLRGFVVERLGVGDWPAVDEEGAVIRLEDWRALTDIDSGPTDPVVFAVDVAPDRAWSSIAVAGAREDGLYHVETVDRRRGTGWVVGRLSDLVHRHKPAAVVLDNAGPANSLLPELIQQQLGVKLIATKAGEMGQACGFIFDAVEGKNLRHGGTPELAAAIRGAAKRPLQDSWAWTRRQSSVDITPLVAVTLALWGFHAQQAPAPFIL